MTLGNAKVLYKHFLDKGMELAAKDLLRRFPQLEADYRQEKEEEVAEVKDDVKVVQEGSEQPKKEVRKHGKTRKG